MGRPKGSKNKGNVKAAPAKTKVAGPRKDPRVKEIYEEEIEFMCPIRGLVKQKVKVRKFRPLGFEQRQLMGNSDTLADIESKDDGLSIYSEDDVKEE